MYLQSNNNLPFALAILIKRQEITLVLGSGGFIKMMVVTSGKGKAHMDASGIL